MLRKLSAVAVFFLALVSIVAAGDIANPFGKPESFKPGSKAKYAVWYEKGQWHLLTTSKGGKDSVTFAGHIIVVGDKFTGDFDKLEKRKGDKDPDFITVHRDNKGFDFQFATYGKVDDVSWRPGERAKTVKFKLLIDGKDVPESILIGKDGEHPDKAEFTLPAHPKKK